MSLLFNMLSRLVIDFLPRSTPLLISWLPSSYAVILKPKEINYLTVFIVPPSIWHEVMGFNANVLIFWMLSFKPAFSLSSFNFIKWLQFLFAFFHKSDVICISEVIDIFLGNLDSRLCFIQQAFRMIHSAYKLNKQGDNIQPWCTPLPIWNQSTVLYLVLTVASWPAYRFLRRQIRWSVFPISLGIFHSLLWSTQSKALA